MRRVPVVVVVVVAAAAGCSPAFDVTVGWTVDGQDPALVCQSLPAGNIVRLSALSRDTSGNSLGRETLADTDCDTGSASIQSGSFAEVRAEIVVDEDVYGTSGVVDIAPGAPGAEPDPEVAVDIHLIRGSLIANLKVGGQDCEAAGAQTFTVSLFENTEPRTNVAVVEGVNVVCANGAAVFTHSPVDLDSSYVIQAVTTVGAASFATRAEGEGVRTAGANTFFTVDLDSID